jgi:hypothetical protein
MADERFHTQEYRDETLALLKIAWDKHPTLTLGELVDVAARLSGAKNAWDAWYEFRPALKELAEMDEGTRFNKYTPRKGNI